MSENKITFPVKLASNNPQSFGIADATEISGHKSVDTLSGLYAISDPVLSTLKDGSDAIGQEWFVVSEDCKYRLDNWANRKSVAGWTKLPKQELVNTKQSISEKDQPNGYAGLDSNGKLPIEKTYGDTATVVEVETYESLPVTGLSGVIYYVSNTSAQYKWSGSAYIDITDGADNAKKNETSIFDCSNGTSTKYYASLSAAINVVPPVYRTSNRIISYLSTENATTTAVNYQYHGIDSTTWTDLTKWERVPNQSDLTEIRSDLNELETIVEQVKDGGLEDGSIELPKLSTTLAAYIGSGGAVVNQADDDDLENTLINGVPAIREKTTKTYTPETYSGMGRVILRKNMVEGVNVLTQSMVNQANTIYEIRYDFALNENITIPANCILEFDGGSISGEHTITGNNTGIKAGLVKIFNTDVTLAGSWNVCEVFLDWFGAIGDGVTDNSDILQKCIDFSHNNRTSIILKKGLYRVTKTIVAYGDSNIIGNSRICNIVWNWSSDDMMKNCSAIFFDGEFNSYSNTGISYCAKVGLKIDGIETSPTTHGGQFKNIAFVGNVSDSSNNLLLVYLRRVQHFNIDGCIFTEFHKIHTGVGVCIRDDGSQNVITKSLFIYNKIGILFYTQNDTCDINVVQANSIVQSEIGILFTGGNGNSIIMNDMGFNTENDIKLIGGTTNFISRNRIESSCDNNAAIILNNNAEYNIINDNFISSYYNKGFVKDNTTCANNSIDLSFNNFNISYGRYNDKGLYDFLNYNSRLNYGSKCIFDSNENVLNSIAKCDYFSDSITINNDGENLIYTITNSSSKLLYAYFININKIKLEQNKKNNRFSAICEVKVTQSNSSDGFVMFEFLNKGSIQRSYTNLQDWSLLYISSVGPLYELLLYVSANSTIQVRNVKVFIGNDADINAKIDYQSSIVDIQEIPGQYKGLCRYCDKAGVNKPIWWNGTAWVDATGATV